MELTARFDQVRTLKEAGFRIWTGDGAVLAKAAPLVGNSVSARFDALSPDTEYSYLVYFSNGLTESSSEAKTFCTLQAPEPPEPPEEPDTPDQPDQPDEPVDNTKFDPTLLAYLLEHYDTDGDGEQETGIPRGRERPLSGGNRYGQSRTLPDLLHRSTRPAPSGPVGQQETVHPEQRE